MVVSGRTAKCRRHAMRTPADLAFEAPVAWCAWRLYPFSLALCLKRWTWPMEALVSWMRRMSSSASAMYLVAVFQEVTLAVTIDRDGGVLLRLPRAPGLDPGVWVGASPRGWPSLRGWPLLKTLVWQIHVWQVHVGGVDVGCERRPCGGGKGDCLRSSHSSRSGGCFNCGSRCGGCRAGPLLGRRSGEDGGDPLRDRGARRRRLVGI